MAQGLLKSNRDRDGLASALLWNVSELENGIYEVQEEWQAKKASFQEIEASMEQAGLRRMNRPNLLKQNFWTNMTERTWTTDGQTYTLPAGDYIYGDASRVSGPGPYMDSVRSSNGQDTDEITETLVTLTGDDIIMELDGESYAKAIAFAVVNPPEQGWGNADQLLFNHGWGTNNENGLLDLQDGEVYTMSCWARVTNGTKMRLRFGWGENLNGYAHSPSKEELGEMTYKYIEIDNTTWERVTWSFVYRASQTWTETYNQNTAAAGDPPVWTPFNVTYTENYQKRVSFGVCRKYAGTVQLCGFRLVRGKLWISETYDDINQGLNTVKDRVTALETRMTALESRVTALENGKASSTNPSFFGSLSLDGVTLTPTMLSELINSLEEVAPYDPETPAEPVEETEAEPSSP